MPVPLSEGGQPSVKSLRGGSIARFWPQGGGRLQDFRREAPEIGAEGAVLENFFAIFRKIVA